MLGALVDGQGNLVAEQRVPTPHDGEQLLDAMEALFRHLEAAASGPVGGVGVGAAGLVDRDGQLCYGPNVGGVHSVPVRTGMEQRLPGVTVRVDNDNTCATWGECLLGAGRGLRNMAMVGLGTGIGGGIVSDGRLLRGEHGFSAEFGHMTIDPKGVLCVCGKLGCWEAYASGRALGRLGREAAASGALDRVIDLAGGRVDDIRGEHVTKAARMGDEPAMAVMEEFAWFLAVGIANLIAVLDPQAVVIAGGLAEETDLYFSTTQRHLGDIVMGVRHRPVVPVVVATLGERAGAIGAAMMVHTEEVPVDRSPSVPVMDLRAPAP